MNEIAKKFTENLEVGWDFAITNLEYTSFNPDLMLLCKIYWQGYEAQDYTRRTYANPDDGLCYEIGSFAIHKILEVLENEN